MCLLMGILAENTSKTKQMQSTKMSPVPQGKSNSTGMSLSKRMKHDQANTGFHLFCLHANIMMQQEGNKNKNPDVLTAFDWETGTDSGQPECTGISAELSKTRTGNSGFSLRGLQSLYHSAGHGTTPAAASDGNGLQGWPGFTWIKKP